jgi:glycosyltransferase involved in cell wall biosynthesis
VVRGTPLTYSRPELVATNWRMNQRKIHPVILVVPLGGSGPHTGHQTLFRDMAGHTDVVQIKSKRNLLTRTLGKGIGMLNHYGHRDHSLTAGEFFFDLARRKSGSIGHLSAVEYHFPYLQRKSKKDPRLCGTIHFPLQLSQESNRATLQRLGGAVCFWTREFEGFEKYVGKGRLHFIHHGVDTEFFVPPINPSQVDSPRILVAGQFLRNFEMLQRVVKKLIELHPLLEFDFLIPESARKQKPLLELFGMGKIRWHAGLSEVQLKEQYQTSYIHLLPMNDSGANNAIVESLACGLPVITTDVGGIRDYGGDTLFPIVANNDDDAMISLVEQYLSRTAWRNEIAQKCRRFAEEELAWPLIAKKHLQVYQELAA